jgi:hypothetical protein
VGGGCVTAGGAAGASVAVGAFSCVTVGGAGAGAATGCEPSGAAGGAGGALDGALGEGGLGSLSRSAGFEFSIAAMASGALRWQFKSVSRLRTAGA